MPPPDSAGVLWPTVALGSAPLLGRRPERTLQECGENRDWSEDREVDVGRGCGQGVMLYLVPLASSDDVGSCLKTEPTVSSHYKIVE